MRRTIPLILTLLLVTAGPAAAQQVTLLHLSDSHSHLAAWGPKDANLDGTLGGLPKAAAIVAAERARDGNALFVHAGDFLNGDLFFNEYRGVPELQLLDALGLDAMLLGNRDFQQGPDFLRQVLEDAWPAGDGVPILATNIDSHGHALGGWMVPTLVKEVNGVKVGLIGLSYKGALAMPSPVEILPYLPAAAAAVSELRGQDVQLVICLTHFGMEKSVALAASLGGIDVIVNAHDNAVLARPLEVDRPGDGKTLIVSAGNFYRWVGRLRLTITGNAVTGYEYDLIDVDQNAAPLGWVQATVDDLKSGIVARYGDVFHQQLAQAHKEYAADWNPTSAKGDTLLGNLFADAYRERGQTDVGLEVLGVLDDPLPRGPVVGADVFRSMSFSLTPVVAPDGRLIVLPLKLVTYQTTGRGLIAALELTLNIGRDGFPQVSGMRFEYDSTKPKGSRVLLDSVTVGGAPLVLDQTYSVTIHDYAYTVFAAYKVPMSEVTLTDDYAFEAARTLVQDRGELIPDPTNRIRNVALD